MTYAMDHSEEAAREALERDRQAARALEQEKKEQQEKQEQENREQAKKEKGSSYEPPPKLSKEAMAFAMLLKEAGVKAEDLMFD